VVAAFAAGGKCPFSAFPELFHGLSLFRQIVLRPQRSKIVPQNVCMTASAVRLEVNAARTCAMVAAVLHPICWEIPEPINRHLAAKTVSSLRKLYYREKIPV